jgi:flagellar basal body-associated protein FliL
MMRFFSFITFLLSTIPFIGALVGCTPPPAYDQADCSMYTELGPVRANPAGAMGRNVEVQISLRVCPPEEGLAEIKRKRIELKHNMLQLLSAKTTAQLEDPLRVETLQKEVRKMVNDNVLKKGKAVEVFITGFEVR